MLVVFCLTTLNFIITFISRNCCCHHKLSLYCIHSHFSISLHVSHSSYFPIDVGFLDYTIVVFESRRHSVQYSRNCFTTQYLYTTQDSPVTSFKDAIISSITESYRAHGYTARQVVNTRFYITSARRSHFLLPVADAACYVIFISYHTRRPKQKCRLL